MRTRPSLRPTVEPDGTLIVPKPRPTANDFTVSVLAAVGLMTLSSQALAFIADGQAAGSPARAALALGIAVGGAFVAALGLAIEAARAPRGTWRLDADRVEFLGRDGARRALAWAEVARGQMLPSSIRLVGRLERFRIDRAGLDDGDWQVVRDRVEAILSPRFDMTVAPPPNAKMMLRRVFLASVASCLFILLSFRAVIHDPIRWGRPVVWGWLLVLTLPLIPCTILALRDNHRRTWRLPRPARGEQKGPRPEIAA